MTALPLVTVLIPARNEERDIEQCLEAVLAQDYPKGRLEVIVVDGASTDRTAAVAARILSNSEVDARIVRNDVGTTPTNLNMGLDSAAGAVLCRIDARSTVPPDYVRRCVEVLSAHPTVSVTGGSQVAWPRSPSPVHVGIARALNNPWTMGGSRYRRNAESGPADTVYLGAFRTEQLRSAGGWDPRFLTNQDFELNQRMRHFGTVWYQAGLPVGYAPRASISEVFKQYQRFGRWKAKYWRWTGRRVEPRQQLLLALPPLAVLAAMCLCKVFGPRRTLGAVIAGALIVESRTAGPPTRSGRAVVASVLASVAVSAGWTVGVLSETLRPEEANTTSNVFLTACRHEAGEDHGGSHDQRSETDPILEEVDD